MSKSSLATLFGSDVKKEVDGIVVEFGPVRVRLARAGGANKIFGKLFEEKMRPYRRMIANELLPDETAQRILFEAYAEAVVLEWSGVTDEQGEDIEYSPAACVEQFTAYPDFFRFVKEESERLRNFRTASEETDTKN